MSKDRKPVALVTGATGGIGQAICDLFAKQGYKVVGVDNQDVPDFGHDFVKFDISGLHRCDDTCRYFYDQVEDRINGRLDVLINNAAVQILKAINDVKAEDWDSTLATNLLAPFWLVQHFSGHLCDSKGSVINIASIHAAQTKSTFTLYAASKSALISMTRSLAIELGPEVRVNAVLPAATDTRMLRDGFVGDIHKYEALARFHPLKKIASPTEIANIVLFLASRSASFMTGAAVMADGGISACLHDPNE